MRLTVKFQLDDPLVLPINYQHILQGFIYRTLGDDDFSTFLHNDGFHKGKRSFKLFTFSRLFGKNKVDVKNKQIIFFDEVEWHVSSILPQFIQNLCQNLLTAPENRLLGYPISVQEVSYNKLKIHSSRCLIKMLSPITVYSTYEDESGKKKTQFFDPNDTAFPVLIEQNLIKKYEAYYGKAPERRSFSITPIDIHPRDKVVTRYKNFIINAWGGTYEVRSSPELIQFAYAVGIGGKNSQGFGMFGILKVEENEY